MQMESEDRDTESLPASHKFEINLDVVDAEGDEESRAR